VIICGNDAAAKTEVTKHLGAWFGWKPGNVIDLGDITGSRGTEMFLPLWLQPTSPELFLPRAELFHPFITAPPNHLNIKCRVNQSLPKAATTNGRNISVPRDPVISPRVNHIARLPAKPRAEVFCDLGLGRRVVSSRK